MRKNLTLGLLVSACASGVDVSGGLLQVELVDEFCGAAMTSCTHLGRQVVTFDAGVLTRHTCLEGIDGGSLAWGPERGEGIVSRPLTAAQLSQVREAVEGLRVAPDTLQNLDGAMSEVILTTPRGTRTLSPGAACGPEGYERIVEGYPRLSALVSGF